MKLRTVCGALTLCALAWMMNGCKQTYSEEKIAQELINICHKEYGIDNVQVKAVGTTIGVFLPLQKLFNTNFKEALSTMKLQNMESLLQPSQEALDKVEDVLFTTSRVVLSTDKKVDFYVLQATDVESTGLQLVLTGYVDDIKRVRLWDISRSEYRKRVFHDLRLNRTALWLKPVKQLLEDIGKKPADLIVQGHFVKNVDEEAISSLFYTTLLDGEHKQKVAYEFLDIRSQASQEGEALVYVKFKETYQPKTPSSSYQFLYSSGTVLEYIFAIRGVSPAGQFRIAQVIPFYFVDDNKAFKRVSFPAHLKLEESLKEWQPLFDVEEVQLGDFLAAQITRRIETLLAMDERILNTFNAVKVAVKYHKAEKEARPFFSLDFNVELKDPSVRLNGPDWINQ